MVDLDRIYVGDSLSILKSWPDSFVQTVVTSPLYWGLRDYGTNAQIGLESSPEEYVANIVAVFREVRRVLKKDGTCCLNVGDSYAGSGKGPTGKTGIGNQTKRQGFDSPRVVIPAGLKAKDLVGIPWRVAFALQADGWFLRCDIIWAKPNPIPESVKDRPTRSHEYIFLLSKSAQYFYNSDAIKEPAIRPGDRQTFGGQKARASTILATDPRYRNGNEQWGRTIICGTTRNKRDVWSVAVRPFKGAHFATFPPALIEPCILAGSSPGDIVLDPFMGAGTTGLVAKKFSRKYLGIEINPVYVGLAATRISEVV